MDHAQHRIAVLDGIHDDPYGKQVIDLIQRLILVYHLPVNTEKVLDPAVHGGFDPRLLDMRLHLVHNRLYISFPNALSGIDLIHQIIVSLRLQIFQGQIIQLHLDLTDAQPVCDGGIDIQRLSCDPLLLFRRHIF